MNEVTDLWKTVWRFRYLILAVFLSTFCLDMFMGAIRMIITQGIVFGIGVMIGRYGHSPAAAPIVTLQPVAPQLENTPGIHLLRHALPEGKSFWWGRVGGSGTLE